MVDVNKKAARDYFDEVAGMWSLAAYGNDQSVSPYPTGKIRTDITLSQIDRLNNDVPGTVSTAVDLGCGTGELLLGFADRGLNATGVDIAVAMVDEANRLVESHHTGTSVVRAVVGDAENYASELSEDGSIDVVTAMGLIEYLQEDSNLLASAFSMLRPGGMMFVQCRNRLFNLCSANRYTKSEASDQEIPMLLEHLEASRKFSPIGAPDSNAIKSTVERLGELSQVSMSGPANTTILPQRGSDVLRRQHTPVEFAESCQQAGLELESIVYYRMHPIPPGEKELFPDFYNAFSLAMQPLGTSPVVAAISSSFVARIRKPLNA